ncbi:rod shape-determining protein MreD [Lysobacter pythonis]|uniref:Rod shape-determining protein MreD n=1 Tax=Solilutibacter pythonis TaxID=2483112 RepID=A0A3M2HG17_9GAMM|nr:rod shape-determining protein MreD [Lysobacter pythonis]RMH87908.1 rod shape-determining protein MreD [Lysobacter pythonis]
MSRERSPRVPMLASALAAILLALVPLPPELAGLRPYWLALVVAYWVLEAPERAGLGFAFLAGLAADLAHGALLGEQALRLVILAFILDRFRSRLRFFPIWQQALVIGALLVNDRIVAAVTHALTGVPQWPAGYWLSPLTGALLWGPLFLVLDTLRHRRRRD